MLRYVVLLLTCIWFFENPSWVKKSIVKSRVCFFFCFFCVGVGGGGVVGKQHLDMLKEVMDDSKIKDLRERYDKRCDGHMILDTVYFHAV